MIREGKTGPEPWLHLPADSFPVWAALNAIKMSRVMLEKSLVSDSSESPSHAVPAEEKGLFATQEIETTAEEPMLAVPADLILSHSLVQELARADARFLELRQACREFIQVSYGIETSVNSPVDHCVSRRPAYLFSYFSSIKQQLHRPWPASSSKAELPLKS